MRYPTMLLLPLLLPGAAHAAGPRIGVEIERERDRDSRVAQYGVTLQPGWQFASGSVIDRVELLVAHERDARADATGERERESKVFLRLRHSGKVTESLTYYLRGGVGRNFNDERHFTYAYVEPGFKYGLGERCEWTLGLRESNAIDGHDGEHVHKLITGPSFSFDRHHEIELRYIRTTGDQRVHGWGFSYVYKY